MEVQTIFVAPTCRRSNNTIYKIVITIMVPKQEVYGMRTISEGGVGGKINHSHNAATMRQQANSTDTSVTHPPNRELLDLIILPFKQLLDVITDVHSPLHVTSGTLANCKKCEKMEAASCQCAF